MISSSSNYLRLPPAFLAGIILFLGSCATTGIPGGIQPVTGFELERYLGTWYEIARLDHRFERGLENVTATYSMNADGSVKVENSGIYAEAVRNAGQRNSAEGRAKFVGSDDIGHLKVSFFGPFYGSYIVFELDRENYGHALVAGPNRKYLWVLARKPDIDDNLYDELVSIAKANGYDTDALIRVVHSPET